MSFNVTNCISKSLSLTDVNITFSGKIEEKILRKLNTLVFEAKLTYEASFCPACGNSNPFLIIKHGSKKAMVRILPANGQPAAINLKQQRFLCKECKTTFTAQTPIVEKYHSISNKLIKHMFPNAKIIYDRFI